ncbi:MAG: protein TonB [Motiliproteus sp.]|jgi:protein TonB
MQPVDLRGYPPLPLPWTEEPEQKALFHRLVALSLGTLLSLFLIVTFIIELPEVERQQREKVPRRLATLMLEKQRISLPELNKQELNKQELRKQELKVPELKTPALPAPPAPKFEKAAAKAAPEPEKPKQLARLSPPSTSASTEPTPEQLSQARDTAASSGILALQSQLRALQNLNVLTQRDDQPLRNVRAGRAQRNNPDLLGRGALTGSGGIQTTALEQSGSATLAARQTTRVSAPEGFASDDIASDGIASNTNAARAAQARGVVRIKQRSPEEISLVFDRHKAAFYALYRRELRSQLGLRGRVIFNFSINPAGRVIDCSILSSDLNNPALERKLRARVMLLAFEAKSVEPWKGLYHIDFLPAG